MPGKKKWVPASSIDANIFQVPPKASKAIVIKEPKAKRPPTPSALPSATIHHRQSTLQSEDQWPAINSTNSDKHSLRGGKEISVISNDIALAQPVVARCKPSTESQTSTNRLAQRSGIKLPPTTITNGSDSSTRTADTPIYGKIAPVPKIRSNLDIYAPKFVAPWLLAINESYAVTTHAPQIARPKYDEYRLIFAGTHMMQQLHYPDLPPMFACASLSAEVLPENYETYWHQRLQNEYAAQDAQNHSYALYGIEIYPAERTDPSLNIYRLKVPGLRESTPRIDLGDILLIRPFMPAQLHNPTLEAQQWSVHRIGFAPGFVGTEHHAVVWSILRRDEVVLVRLGKALPLEIRCNVIIPSQIHKNVPTWRAVSAISPSLIPGKESWLSSMLFPSRGVPQTTLSKGNFTLRWRDNDLNFEQMRAVQAIVDAEYGTVPYLVSGPPGTGKTKTMVEVALQLLANPRKVHPHILVCAPSDAAADTLLIRLSEHLSSEKLFRLNNWTRLPTEVSGDIQRYSYLDENQLYSLPDFETLMSFQVVVTTCRDANVLVSAGLTNSDLGFTIFKTLRAVAPSSVESVNPIHWTALILDEAAQATEPEALVPLSVVAPFEADPLSHIQTPQVIMAGDQHQLGPRLVSRALPSQLGIFDTAGLEIPLFQRLFERPFFAQHPLSRSHGLRPLTKAMLPIIRPAFANLIRNYRSHPTILTTSSALFYSDTLIPERSKASAAILSWPHWPGTPKSVWPVMFYQNRGQDNVESVLEGNGTGSGSLTNYTEARIALDIMKSLLSHVNTSSANFPQSSHIKPADIIVMSPFRAQVNHLRQRFRDSGFYDTRIGPLEAFQGLESKVVIMCTTRTSLGQHPQPLTKFVAEDRARNLGVIDEPKSFNVAMTRAQEALIVIGNAEVLTVTRDPCWLSFLRFCVRNDLCVGQVSWFGKDMSREGASQGMGKLERALKYAEGLQELGTPCENENDDSAERLKPSADSGESFKFKLKGTMIDLDERMWEMQIGDDDENAIRAEEEEDDVLDEVDSGEDDKFEGIDEYEHDNTRVGEPVD